MPRTLKTERVCLDVLTDDAQQPIWFDALVEPTRWNGWAVPYFTFDEAQRIVTAFNQTTQKRGVGVRARYEEDTDEFIFVDAEPDTDDERFSPTLAFGLKMYPIGAGIWCWWAEQDPDMPQSQNGVRPSS